jgi:hypothetical protein
MNAISNSCFQIVLSFLDPKDILEMSQFYDVNFKLYLSQHKRCAFGYKSLIHDEFEKECKNEAIYLVVQTGYTSRIVNGQQNMSLFKLNKRCKKRKTQDEYDKDRFSECENEECIDILRNALAIQDCVWGQGVYLRNDIKDTTNVHHANVVSLCRKYPGCVIFDLTVIKSHDIDIISFVENLKLADYCAWYTTYPVKYVELDNGTFVVVVEADTESG